MFAAQHTRLVSACYPSAPLAAGPDFKPNSQELSRLTYFGSNKPGKLAKIGQEVEKHAQTDSRRAASHPKSRASLLITLEILRTISTECKLELSLFGRYVVASVDLAVAALPNDLEVVARSARVFIAYATFTDGKSIAVDEPLARSYLSVLQRFAVLSKWDSQKQKDEELRARSQLVGLAALTAAIGSDALYCSTEVGRAQASIIVPALLSNIRQAGLNILQQQETVVEESQAASPYFSEFQPHRPLAQRRAASIHVHTDGVEGPNTIDVIFGALRAMKNLLGRSDGAQVTTFLASLFEYLDSTSLWGDVELCQWLALNITEWTQYQHRYAIPVRLISKLVETPDESTTSMIHGTLLVMITSVFSSRTPIANLATSDVISSLITFILRRVDKNPSDPILPTVVNCVSSLGTHLYYADQIQDFAEEIIRKLGEVQAANIGRDGQSAQEGMRCLVSCLSGLIRVASKHSTNQDPHHTSLPETSSEDGGKSRRNASVVSAGGRRNLISPETWQETLALLVEANYGLRSEYARTLAMFLDSEIPKEEPFPTASQLSASSSKTNADAAFNDEVMRFLHIMNITVYALAVTPSVSLKGTAAMIAPSDDGASTSAASVSEQSQAPSSPITPFNRSGTETESETGTTDTDTNTTLQLTIQDVTPTASPVAEVPPSEPAMSIGHGHKTSIAASSVHQSRTHRSRTASLAFSLIERVGVDVNPTQLVWPTNSPAGPNDYSHIVAIMSSAIRRTPARAILVGVPMLIAWDKLASAALVADDVAFQARRQAMREALAQIWAVIAATIESTELKDLSQKALHPISSSNILPTLTVARDDFAQPAEQALPYPSDDHSKSALSTGALRPVMDAQAAILILTASPKLYEVTQLDRAVLRARLETAWTPVTAVGGSSGQGASGDASRTEGSHHFLKISPQLMHIDNKSLASLARSTRNVGVGDLREALEGRASANRSSVGLGYHGSPSMSSIGHHSSVDHSGEHGENPVLNQLQARLRATSALKDANGEVKDILNKLGIGKQSASRTGVRTKPAFKSPLKRGISQESSTPTPASRTPSSS
ncbi:hypothetical protein DL93DRAFT_427020 [Clavulina sp. PMI_390]|nr:hypothetical protein DL93DRAFT_427020 [Clavulina sp. PMI_390]